MSLTTTTHAHCTHLILQVTKPSAITDLWVEVWLLFEWLKSVGEWTWDTEIMHHDSIRWKGKNHSLSSIFQDLRSHEVATGSTRALPRQEAKARPRTELACLNKLSWVLIPETHRPFWKHQVERMNPPKPTTSPQNIFLGQPLCKSLQTRWKWQFTPQ